ncbi:hypothetical protein [Bailinhaonella thermotolerans]|uniref:hypothetical protein n=1 Tax=Bailinhaonella thermotolerans TaxID=1070861 RepID=UPI00192A529F|nr:hypothetical protein [Bailinhaonella thermotolerans]
MDSGIVLLIFLAVLTAWAINWAARRMRLKKIGYAGIIIVFVLTMIALYGQTVGSR